LGMSSCSATWPPPPADGGSGGLIAGRGHLQNAIELVQRCPLSRTASSMGDDHRRRGRRARHGLFPGDRSHDHAEKAALVKLMPEDARLGNATLYSRLNRATLALRDPAATLSASSPRGRSQAVSASAASITAFSSLAPRSVGVFRRCRVVTVNADRRRTLGAFVAAETRYGRPFPRLDPGQRSL
jgi:hypothetical protein